MAKHIFRQLARLKDEVLGLGSLAEIAISQAITALANQDDGSAKKAMAMNADIDRAAVDLQEECLQTLALYQPAARDLRLVVAILKISNELRRVAELAKNVAKRASYLSRTRGDRTDIDFRSMGEHAQNMLRASLDALIRGDSSIAHQVRRDDDALDSMRRSIHNEIRAAIRQAPQQAETLLKLYAVAKHLERIGDMATNIAADVIYMVDGVIVRHSQEE
ncbi:MAG TPA: phosphate signaling complex protein PhoU [Pirellulales bacterium]|nr:phosphate signaling complex protein PhoU [Pirellulales bacterium]